MSCALSCLCLRVLSSSSQKPWPARRAEVCCVTGATPIAGGFTPGTFTSQIPAGFREPRLLVVTDPRADYQPLLETFYANLPTMLLVTDSALHCVHIATQATTEGSSLSVSDVVEPGLGSSVLAPSPVSTSAETPRR